jgi:hypothetical protein
LKNEYTGALAGARRKCNPRSPWVSTQRSECLGRAAQASVSRFRAHSSFGTPQGEVPAMKVVLIGGWARERVADEGLSPAHDHDDIQRYAYGIGLLRAVVHEDPAAAERTAVAVHNFPIELFQQRLDDDALALILAEHPTVVGFSCRCWDVRVFLATAAELKARAPNVRILLGGPSVSFDARDLLAANPAVEIIARGEAERTFLALCRSGFEQLVDVPGITWRAADGSICEQAEESVPIAMEDVPSPYLTGAFVPPLHRILVEHARGCRFQCGFCAIPRIRRRLGHRSAERFAAELRWAVEHGYTSIDISSSAVNHDTEQLRSICTVLRTFDRAVRVQGYLQLERVDQEQVDLLRTVHFDDLIIGIESVNDDVRRLCGKAPLDRAALEQKLALLTAAGQTMNLFNILGLPGDTLASFRDTLAYLDELTRRHAGAMGVSFAWHTLLPGSGFWQQREKLGITTSQIGMAHVMSTAVCTWEDLCEMARLVVRCAETNPAIRTDGFVRLVAADRVDPDCLRAGSPPLRERPASASPRAPSVSVVPLSDPLEYAFLLHPWRPRERRDGWTFQRALAATKGEEIAVFELDFERGGVTARVYVHVAPRDDARPAYERTRKLNIYYRVEDGRPAPDGALERMLRAVCGLVARNEAALGHELRIPLSRG